MAQTKENPTSTLTEEQKAKIHKIEAAYGAPLEKGQSPFDKGYAQSYCTENCQRCSNKCDVAEAMEQRDRQTLIADDLKVLLKFHKASVEEVMNVLKTLA